MASKFLKYLTKPENNKMSIMIYQNDIKPGEIWVQFNEGIHHDKYLLTEEDLNLRVSTIDNLLAVLLLDSRLHFNSVNEEDLLIRSVEMDEKIVRCKDCKHQVKNFISDKRYKEKGYYICYCGLIDGPSYGILSGQDDEYCSYGERKPNE